jgi:hypothetical protein
MSRILRTTRKEKSPKAPAAAERPLRHGGVFTNISGTSIGGNHHIILKSEEQSIAENRHLRPPHW